MHEGLQGHLTNTCDNFFTSYCLWIERKQEPDDVGTTTYRVCRTECSPRMETTTVMSNRPKINKNVLVISINHRQASLQGEQMKPIINNSATGNFPQCCDRVQTMLISCDLTWVDNWYQGFPGGKWMKSHNSCHKFYTILTLVFRPFIVLDSSILSAYMSDSPHYPEMWCQRVCLPLSISFSTL